MDKNSVDYVERSLLGLVPKMKEVVIEAIQLINMHHLPFGIFETTRSLERQHALFLKGYSKVDGPNSHTDGRAVDIVYVEYSPKCYYYWPDEKDCFYWYEVLHVLLHHKFPQLTCGIDWKSFGMYGDSSHYELPKTAIV